MLLARANSNGGRLPVRSHAPPGKNHAAATSSSIATNAGGSRRVIGA